MGERAFQIHLAKVYLTECRRREHQRPFQFVLMGWAANARRRAATVPMQANLFATA